MLGENGYPETPDWLPESRDVVAEFKAERHWDESDDDRLARFRAAMKPHAACPAHVSQPLTWDGDDS